MPLYGVAPCRAAPYCRGANGASFREDKGVEPHMRSRLADFRGSGYDRGHMVRMCTAEVYR